MPPQYDPAAVEPRWAVEWIERGYFQAYLPSEREPYCIVIPPPNVTGRLHIGHALQHSLQDVLVRRARMQGYETLWLPGMDHAGIATQVVVERELRKEGIDRRDIGRDAFVERVWQWKEQYGGEIVDQIKRMGNSLDWSRERFTMDEGLSRAVREAFVRWYDEGLIYRGERLVNWCPTDQTGLSDSEVEHEDSGVRICPMPSQTSVRVSARVAGFTYAIRNIVAEAKKVEAAGRKVRYLNIGDPVPFGFQPPPHVVQAINQAMRDGYNGYTPSSGIASAREAVAAEYSSRGMPLSADRVVLTSGTSEGIGLALAALADAGDEVLIPSPTYPLYTALLAQLEARPVFYRTDPQQAWQPDLDDLKRRITPLTRAIVVIDPNNPTGAVYPASTRRAIIELAERSGIPILADEVYAELAFDGPHPLLASLAPDAPIISFSSLSKAYLAPGWRAGWLAVGRSDRLDDVLSAIKKLADGRLCSPGPMQFAIQAALEGDRSFQQRFISELKARAAVTTERLNAMPGMRCVAPRAAFYVMPQVTLPAGRTDEDFVLGLLRAKGILCVYGSGFGYPAAEGTFRIVFLASPAELGAIYDDIGEFTAEFLGARG